jgi:hypothetical protein
MCNLDNILQLVGYELNAKWVAAHQDDIVDLSDLYSNAGLHAASSDKCFVENVDRHEASFPLRVHPALGCEP